MINSVPRAEKNIVVTPKNPTKKGPIQKSKRSPPIKVPPRTRYFLSKLSIAIAGSSTRRNGIWRHPVLADQKRAGSLSLLGRGAHGAPHGRVKPRADPVTRLSARDEAGL